MTTWRCSRRPPRDVTFPAKQRLFEDGGSATRFWLLQSGHVCLDLHVPGQGRMKIDTIGMGELLGWSWLFPPYRWAFGAVAASPVEAFEFDARTVREPLRRRSRARLRGHPAARVRGREAPAGDQGQADHGVQPVPDLALTGRQGPRSRDLVSDASCRRRPRPPR